MREKIRENNLSQHRELFDEVTSKHPKKLQEENKKRWDVLQTIEWPPSRKQEKYKYSHFRPLSKLALSLCDSDQEREPLEERYTKLKNRLVFEDASLNTQLSQIEESSEVQIRPLGKEEDRKEEESALYRETTGEEALESPLFTLNQLLFQGGVSVNIPAKTELKEPIYLLRQRAKRDQSDSQKTDSQTSGQTAGQTAVTEQTMHKIVVGDHSRVTICLLNEGDEGLAWFNTTVELEVGDSAHVTFATVNSQLPDLFFTQTLLSRVAKNGHLQTLSCDLGLAFSRYEMHVDMHGEGGHVDLFGLYTPLQDEINDHSIRLRHEVAETTSDVIYKGILGGRSLGNFDGGVYVAEDAQKVEALQSNQNILISPKASVDTRPNLEIFADDVSCGHGATVGAMNEDALFYLRSRGISKQEAYQTLLISQMYELLERVDNASLRDFLAPLIDQRVLQLSQQVEV